MATKAGRKFVQLTDEKVLTSKGELAQILTEVYNDLYKSETETGTGSTGGFGGGGGTSSGSQNGMTIGLPTKNSAAEPETPNQTETSPNSDAFSDIDSVPWAKEAIHVMAQRNIINGAGDGRFLPENKVSREEFVKMLVLSLGTYHANGRCSFADVSEEMIKASETGMFDTIIVHKLDRFARSKYDSAIYKQKLKVNNVRLVSVTENLDGTPESIILESVLEAMAEYYSKNLAREIMKGNMENAKKSVHCGGIPPLGFDIIDKKLVVNEHEAEAVKIIFKMYADGEGYTSIINTLNAKGYKTKVGRPFGKNSLFEILRNEKYRGVYTYNKSSKKTAKGTYNRHAYKDDSEVIRIENGCPRIVSDELFNRARKRQCENQREVSTNRNRQKYLLSGLVFCGKCNSPMHANRRRKESQLTFRCNRKSQTIQCNSKEINMSYLEEYVLDELQKNIFSFNKVNAIMQVIRQHTEDAENVSIETANRRNNHQKEYLSFFCPKHKNKQGCDSKEIDLVKLENFTLTRLAELIFTEDNINGFINDFSKISKQKSGKAKKEISELKSILNSNSRKIKNCLSQIENGCTKIVSDKLGERIEELEAENKRITKKLKRLQDEVSEVPEYEEIERLKDNFVEYMQSKNNLPIRKKFLRQMIEEIKVTDDFVEIIFKI